mgnify:CR=1 FL=1
MPSRVQDVSVVTDQKVLIRRAVLQDVPGIVEVLTTTWHDAYDPILGRDRVTELLGKCASFPMVYGCVGFYKAIVAVIDNRLRG